MSSGGKKPVSVTVHDDLVYVLNVDGGKGSINGFTLGSGGELTSLPNCSRQVADDALASHPYPDPGLRTKQCIRAGCALSAETDRVFAKHPTSERFVPAIGDNFIEMGSGMDEQNQSHDRSNGLNSGQGDGDILRDAIKGAIAGAVGVWALDKVTSFMWDREDPAALAQEDRARPDGLDPAHVIANEAAEAMGKQLTPMQPNPAGIAVHYALGIVPGALYGVLRKRVDTVGAAGGALYGLGLFLTQDEGLNPLLGTSGPPGAYPWQAHARGVVGHLVLGLATDTTLDLLDRVA